MSGKAISAWVCAACLLAVSVAAAQTVTGESRPYFYHALGYGSEVGYDPLSFIIKYKFDSEKRYALFYHFGMNGLIGLSYEFRKDDSFSLAGGLRNTEDILVTDIAGARKQTAVLQWNAGFFYDRCNSLLFSLLVTGQRSYQVVANVYPGLVSIGDFSPGFFVASTAGNRVIFGLSVSYVPLGLATNSH